MKKIFSKINYDVLDVESFINAKAIILIATVIEIRIYIQFCKLKSNPYNIYITKK